MRRRDRCAISVVRQQTWQEIKQTCKPAEVFSGEGFYERLCTSPLSLILGTCSERPGAVKGARSLRGEANP
jgi:hypothetical protein